MLLLKVTLFTMWLGAVVDPIGHMFGIRYFGLAGLFVSLLWLFFLGQLNFLEKSYRGFFILFLSVSLPLYGLMLYAFREGGGEFIDTSYLASGVLLLTALLYNSRAMCDFGVMSFVYSTRFMSFIIISIPLFQVVNLFEWASFFTERHVALVSTREYSGVTMPYIYFLASPLLIFLIAYDFFKLQQVLSFKNFFMFTTATISFALTGTRAHMLIAVFFIPLYLFLTMNSRAIIKTALMLPSIIIIILAVPDFRDLIGAFFSSTEASNSLKLTLLVGYAEIFSNPLIILFGQGFNAHEWSLTLRDMIAIEFGASKTELTYLEFVRVFGFINAAIFLFIIILLLISIKKLGRNFNWIYPGLIIFLINSGFNPYLFSVNGMLPLGLITAIAYHYRRTGSGCAEVILADKNN
jgi:hypothetical protein